MIIWGESTAKGFDRWEASSRGRAALACERRLLHRIISPWPRRRQKLLEIGCGTGIFLKLFWEAGFDTTGLDRSPAMLERSRSRMGNRVDLHLGNADHLPFDDREFDFTVLITVLEFCADPEKIIAEAVRVTRKGLVIGFLNRDSLYYLSHGRTWPWSKPSTLRQARWFTFMQMRRMVLSRIGPKPVVTRSVLPWPAITWRDSPFFRKINGIILPPLGGAFVAMRIDLVGERAMSPLLAFKRNSKNARASSLQPIARGRNSCTRSIDSPLQ
ncbi:MAG: class I SAM-dependent methyltransferase [Desulfovibrionales bacterium]